MYSVVSFRYVLRAMSGRVGACSCVTRDGGGGRRRTAVRERVRDAWRSGKVDLKSDTGGGICIYSEECKTDVSLFKVLHKSFLRNSSLCVTPYSNEVLGSISRSLLH